MKSNLTCYIEMGSLGRYFSILSWIVTRVVSSFASGQTDHLRDQKAIAFHGEAILRVIVGVTKEIHFPTLCTGISHGQVSALCINLTCGR